MSSLPYVRAIQGPGHSVIYTRSDGAQFKYSGGDWAWRNNNPGHATMFAASRWRGAERPCGSASRSRYNVASSSAFAQSLVRTNRRMSFSSRPVYRGWRVLSLLPFDDSRVGHAEPFGERLERHLEMGNGRNLSRFRSGATPCGLAREGPPEPAHYNSPSASRHP